MFRLCTRRYATQAVKKRGQLSRARELQLGLKLDDANRKKWEDVLTQGRKRGWSEEICARYFRHSEREMKDYMLAKRLYGGQDLSKEDASLSQLADNNYVVDDPDAMSPSHCSSVSVFDIWSSQ